MENADNIKIIRTGTDKTCILEKKEVPYIRFPYLDSTGFVTAAFSTRLGGVSKNYLSSLNLSFERGDSPENVLENYKRICSSIGIDYSNIVASKQTHTTNVIKVTRADRGKGILRERGFDNVDGLITNEPEVVLHTSFADCVPLYIVDTKNKAIGLAHSGWRGTVGKIGMFTINKMHDEFGTDPKDVVVQIGPSICQTCYEVSSDVAGLFIDTFRITDDILIDKGNGKYLLDLWNCLKFTFEEAGVLKQNIHLPDICTCHNYKWLFSHRASKGLRGNLSAFLMINRQ